MADSHMIPSGDTRSAFGEVSPSCHVTEQRHPRRMREYVRDFTAHCLEEGNDVPCADGRLREPDGIKCRLNCNSMVRETNE